MQTGRSCSRDRRLSASEGSNHSSIMPLRIHKKAARAWPMVCDARKDEMPIWTFGEVDATGAPYTIAYPLMSSVVHWSPTA